MDNTILSALLITTLAGASTCIGAIMGITNKKPQPRMISFIMAFSAGVMIFLSFTEMFNEAHETLGMATALLFLGLGLLIAFIIDELLPEQENVHEHLWDNTNRNFEKIHKYGLQDPKHPHDNMFVTIGSEEGTKGRYSIPLTTEHPNKAPIFEPIISGIRSSFKKSTQPHYGQGHHRHRHQGIQNDIHDKVINSDNQCDELFCVDNPKMMKLGIFTMISLFIHNVPEGVATFSATLLDPRLGLQIAIAIMLHNIPEGICVAVPIYSATNDKKKAFWYAALSGVAEPAGALMAWLFLYRILTHDILLMLLSVVAGIMIYISVDTLIPTAKSMDYKHTTILGFSVGMILMGISLIYL